MRKFFTFLLSTCFFFNSFSQAITYPGTTASFCPGGSILLTASNPPIPTGTYQWQLSTNGVLPYSNIAGATASTYLVSSAGFYQDIVSGPPPDTFPPIQVIQNPNPTASFTGAPQSQCSTVPVAFTNNATGAATYLWNFGDPNSGANNTSTLFAPTHRFVGTPGNVSQNFTVTLTATTALGCSVTTTSVISTIQTPSTALGGTGLGIYNGRPFFKSCSNNSSATFSFTNQSTTLPTNTNYQIVWGDASPDFNSPTFSTVLTHVYNQGITNLLFIVTGQNGCKDTTQFGVFLGSNPAVGLGNPGNTAVCTGATLTFPISGTALNTLGTIYSVVFNDGSPAVNFPHPAPASISHNFLTTSCGTNSPGYPNSYSASIQASNPCASSTATVVPIYVSQKSTAQFTISPRDTVCVNTNVTLINATGLNSSIDNGVCTPGKVVWQITPSTGWNITSGTLGNNFGSLDFSLWLGGSNNVGLTFTSTGTYSIKLYSGNATCGIDSITKTICVNPIPTGSYTVDNNVGCAPLTVTTTVATNTPICGINKFLWTVSYSATTGCVPSSSSFNYLNGTNANSSNPQFQFINPGIYTISFVNIFPASACTSAVVTRIITVKAKPVVVLAPVPSVCVSQPVNPTATSTCYINGTSTYAWTFIGGTPATSSTLIPGPVTFATPGPHDVTLAVTNECGTTTVTQQVTVNPLPQLTVPASSSFCVGETAGPFVFTSSTPGTIITWVNNNTAIGLAAAGTGNIPSFVTTNLTAAPIVATITVTANNGTCSKQDNFTITVKPKPALPLVTTPVSYCQNATALLLSATAAAGNTLLWYTTATGGVGSTTAITPQTTTLGTTIYYVSQVSGLYNCEGPRAAISVTVNAVPAITATSTSPTTCGGTNGNITISGLSPSTSYTVNYIKSGTPVTVVLTSNGAGTIVINGLTSGTYTNVYVISNGCPSNETGPFILSDPSQPATPTAGSNGPLCSGGTISFTASSTTVGVTYLWSGPAAFSSSVQNPSIINAAVANSGNYFVTATLNGCTSLATMVSVVVNPTPVLPAVTSNAPICANNNLNLFSSTTTAGAITYAWTSTTGFTSADQNPIIPNAQTINSGMYTVIATATTNGQACPSLPASITVLVKPVPVITLGTATNPINCSSSTGSIQLNVSIFNTIFLVNYTKNAFAQTATLASNATGILTIPNLTAGTYDNFTVTLAGCISNMVGPVTLTDPNPPVTPIVPLVSPVCSGNNINLSASTTSAGTATYLWTGPAFSSVAQNPVIPNATVANSGTYSVVVTIAGCASAAASVNVVVNQTPVTPTITSNSPVCTNNTLTLNSATSTPGLMTYTWTGPNGFTSTLQNPTIPNVTTAVAGIYNVIFTATTGNCASAAGTTNVVINATPVISNGTIANPSACGSATGSINLNGLLSSTFYNISYTNNTIPQTAIGTTNATGILNIPNLTAGTYNNFTVAINGCVSNAVGPFVLVDPNPPVAPIVTANNPLCAGATLNLSASTASGVATYQWSGPNGFNSSLQNPSIINMAAINAGTYSVIATINNCPSTAGSIVVVVNPQAVPPQVTTPINYCIGTTASALIATASTGHSLNWYNVATGGVVLPSAPTPSTAIVGSTFYYVSQTTALGCEGPRAAIEVKINPDALAVFVPTDTMKCAPFSITPSIIGLQPFAANNGSYEWYANNVLIGTGIIFPGYTILNGGDSITIKLKTISPFGCKADSMSRKFYTFKIPVPSFTLSDTVGCGPISITFVNTTPDINLFTYNWNFGNGITSTLQQPGTILFATNPTFSDTTYIIKLKVATVCDTITFQKTVRVKSKPRALYTPSITAGCSPMRVKFTNTSLGLNNTYYWNFDDGTNLTTTSIDTFSHIFTTGVIDTFRVKLVVVNDCGADSITYLIIAQPNNIFLNFSVNGTQLFGCAPHPVAFINNSVGGSSFIWNFGDGNTLSTTNNIDTVYHTYANPGTYTAVLQAINSCTDTAAAKTITVYPKPVPLFIASSYNVCIGQSVQFTNQSTLANSYSWNFGDGTFSTLISPSHTYNSPGLYNVMLTCIRTNPSGNVCIDSFPRQIQVTAGLPGLFSVQNAPGLCAPHTVTFVNRNVPSVTTLWNFGDGTTGTGDSVLHTYNTAGVYTVSLIATVPGGCTYTSQRMVTISGPGGTLQYLGGYKCFPNGVSFIANVSNTDSIRWNFGDGTFAITTSNAIFHNYAGPGIYVPSASFINTAGCNFSVIGIDTIRVDKIDSGFVQSQQKFCGYTNVLFTDTSTAYFGKQLVKWRFGDGGIGTGSIINHTYTNSGTYNVEMIVIGNSGCSDTTIKQLTVTANALPVAAIIGPLTGCTNNLISFSANVVSADTLTNLNWLLSNGVSGSGPNFSYNFTVPGIYNLQLFAGTAQGCFDTANHIITVNPSPVINATNSLVLCRGNSVQLNVVGTSNYQWFPIQGLSCTTCPNPIASPLITTPYFVTGTNSFGCTATDTVVITVIQPTQITVSGNTNICVGDTANLLVSGAAVYTWTPALTLSDSTVSNPLAFPTATTTYRVVGYDGYNCFTDTAFVTVGVGKYPTVSLGPDVTLASGTRFVLASVVTNGPIAQWMWTPTNDLSCTNCALPTATIKKDISYIVKAITAFGCSASDTIKIKVFCENSQLFIPNSFTPDGDGLNDVLMVRGTGIISVKYFRIFNRWGELIFERTNFAPNSISFGWNGKIKGVVGPPDVFVYTAEVICENGTVYTYKGNTSIIK